MAIESEEILARIGLDMTSMQRNTQIMLDQQKKASLEYVGFWEGALSKQARAETAANEASLTRLKAFQDAKLAETKAFLEEQSAMYAEQDAVAAIGQGSIPTGWAKTAEGAAAGAAVRGVGKEAAKEAAEHGGTGAINEFFVLIRESLRGASIARIASSFIRFAGLLLTDVFLPAVTVVLGSLAVSELYAKILGTTGPLEAGKAIYGAYQGNKDEKARQKDIADMYKQHLDTLRSKGIISDSYADVLKGQLDSGDFNTMVRAVGAIDKPWSQYTASQKAENERKEAAKQAQAQSSAEVKYYEEERKSATFSNIQDRMKYDYEMYRKFNSENRYDDAAKAWQNILDDQKQITDELKKQNDSLAEQKKKITELEQTKEGVMASAEADFQKQFGVFPTIEQLARQRIGRRLTATALEARRYESDEYNQWAARAWGNSDSADYYQRDMASIAADFQNRGILKKDETLVKMELHLQNLNQQIAAVSSGNGTMLNVNIDGVSDSE